MRRALTPLSCMFVTMSKWQLPQPRSIRPERPVAITSARGNLETWAEVVSVAVTFESCLNFALDSFQNSYSFQGILEGDRSCIRLFHYSRHQPHCPVPVHFIHSPQGEQYLQEQEATLQDRLTRVGPLRAALSQATWVTNPLHGLWYGGFTTSFVGDDFYDDLGKTRSTSINQWLYMEDVAGHFEHYILGNPNSLSKTCKGGPLTSVSLLQ